MWRPGYDFMEFFSLSTSTCVLGSKLRVSGLHTGYQDLPCKPSFLFWMVFMGESYLLSPWLNLGLHVCWLKPYHWTALSSDRFFVIFFNYLFGNMLDLCCFMAHMWLSEDNLAESKFFSTMWVPGSNSGGQTWWHTSFQYGAISLALQIFFKSLNL